jgi:oxygen-dependent protoporphyrinogen oxidase
MAAELFVPRGEVLADESIASFVGRRFGREAVEYLAEPLLAGIHGGDPARLSMRSGFPRLLSLEERHGSVIAGLRRMPPAAGAGTPFVALADGMSRLTNALVSALPARSLHVGAGVDEITTASGRYVLELSDGRTIDAPSVLLATPPAVTGSLAGTIDRMLGELCGEIRSTSAVTVALGYQRSAIGHPLDGTGFVAPRREGLQIRAASWVSSKWADRAPARHVLLRAYIGGAGHPAAIDCSDADLVDMAERDLGRLLNIVGEPQLTRVYRWRDATPQLEVGHGALMAAIDRRLAQHPGLFVSASGFRGTGIADCVADARAQAACAAEAVTPALTA